MKAVSAAFEAGAEQRGGPELLAWAPISRTRMFALRFVDLPGQSDDQVIHAGIFWIGHVDLADSVDE